MKKHFSLIYKIALAAVLFLAAGSFFSHHGVGMVEALWAQETQQPYVLKFDSFSIWPDAPNTKKYLGSSVEALNGDGAIMWGVTTYLNDKPGVLYQAERTITWPDGSETELNDVVKTKVSWATHGSWVDSHIHRHMIAANPQADCLTDYYGRTNRKATRTIIGHEQVMGVPTTVIAENSSTTYWRAPSLGCAILKLEERFPKSTTVMEPTSITQGETDPALFSDDGYPETTPLQRGLAEQDRLTGLGHANVFGPGYLRDLQALDKKYQQNHSNAVK